jgi:hypothetical protein
VLAKASLVHELLPLSIGFQLDASLPASILELWRTPPPVSTWVPEVRYRALKLATFDAQGLSDAAAMELMRGNYRRLLRNPIYSVLFGLMGAERMLKGAARRWSQFHRGTELALVELGTNEGVVELTTPHPIFHGLVNAIQAMSFEVILERAGGKDVTVEPSVVPTGFRYATRW